MFDDLDSTPSLGASLSTKFVGPPKALAYVPLALGALSVGLGFLLPDVGLLGYVLGLGSVTGGLVYRFVARSRQMDPMYLPNIKVDRVMLVGVLAGFVGIALGAYHLSQRVVL